MKLLKSYLEKGQHKKILDEIGLKLGRLTDEEYIFYFIANYRLDSKAALLLLDNMPRLKDSVAVKFFCMGYAAYSEGDIEGVSYNFAKVESYVNKSNFLSEIPEWASYSCVLGADDLDFRILLHYPDSCSANNLVSKYGGTVFFITCDYLYYLKFVDTLTKSILLFSPNSLIHIHIIDAENSNEIIKNNNFKNVKFSFSMCTFKNKIQYYAVSRFIFLPEIINKYKDKTVITLDADVLVNENISTYIREFFFNKRASISLVSAYHFDLFQEGRIKKTSKYLNHMPWRSIKAGLVAVKPTEEGKRFSMALSNLMLYSIVRNRLSVKWWLDQGVFFSLLSKLSDLGLNHKDILFVKLLYPIELHTLPKAKALGDKKMSKQKYLNLKLNEMYSKDAWKD